MVWRQFHDFTHHRPEGYGGVVDDPDRPRSMDPARRPEPFKEYRGDFETVPLVNRIKEWVEGPSKTDRLGLEELSRFLLLGAGAKRFKSVRLRGRYFRTYASAGALHPNEVYVATSGLAGLDAGLYHFNPRDKSLGRIGNGDARKVLAKSTGDDAVLGYPFVLIVTGIPWRTSWKYGPRGYRHLWWDAGMIIANFIALAESSRQPYRVHTNFADGQVNAALGLDSRTEMALAFLGVGEGPGQTDGEFEPIRLNVAPISNDPYEFPEITEVHRATSMEKPAGEIIARTNPTASRLPGDLHIDQVIWKRGSTRQFDDEASMPRKVLEEILQYGSDVVSSDWGGGLNELHVISHAVDGLDPGAYTWNGRELELVRLDPESRESAMFLSLNQGLGADGVAVVFPMADLNQAAEKLGPRGYRAAQLDGAIASGRLYLASYAAGFGATGLTYYDQEVQKYFGTDKEPTLEVSIGLPAPRTPPPKPTAQPMNLSLDEGTDKNGIPIHWTARSRGYHVSVNDGILLIESNKKRVDHALISQTVEAKPFVGGKVRLSVDLATDCDESSFGALFLGVGNSKGSIAQDAMQDRPVRGERDFQTETVVLDVPAEAEEISFGVWVAGAGTLRAKNVRLTREDSEATATPR